MITPKVAVGAAVSNDKGELLLIQRADSGIWLYPTGWCDVGYSAAEVVVKEVEEEETGIKYAEPVRLIAVLDGLRLGFAGVPLYSLLFYCKAVGGELSTRRWSARRRRPAWWPIRAFPMPRPAGRASYAGVNRNLSLPGRACAKPTSFRRCACRIAARSRRALSTGGIRPRAKTACT